MGPFGPNSYTLEIFPQASNPSSTLHLGKHVSDRIGTVTNLIYVSCTLLLTILGKFSSVPRIGCNIKTKGNCKTE